MYITKPRPPHVLVFVLHSGQPTMWASVSCQGLDVTELDHYGTVKTCGLFSPQD